MSFVKLDCGLLDSTLWIDRVARELFITALLMAEPHELKVPMKQYNVRDLNETGFVVPEGWYGFVPAAGTGIIRRAGESMDEGLLALERLGSKDPESRSPEFEGRRLVRIDGGFIVLNFVKYRDKDSTTAERSRRWRERQKLKALTGQLTTRVSATPSPVIRHQAEAEAEAEAEESLEDTMSRKILNYLNEKTGKKFQAVNGSLKFITARLREGATEDQCRAVIDLKCSKWLNDPKWSEFLRPKTIFNGENFSNYVGEIGADKPKTESIGDSWINYKKQHETKNSH